MLEAVHLQAGYGKKAVVPDFSGHFEPGKLYVLLGPNGSGKSTLLNTLGGWLPALTGSVTINGQTLQALSVKERATLTGRIAPDPGAVSMSAFRYALLGSYARQQTFAPYQKQDYAATEKAMARLQISDLEDRPLDQLSSGERQKVSIAQVLVQNPVCLFLDEPSSSLDPKARFDLMELLCSLKEENRILLVVVHDLDLALRYGDEILVLEKGSEVFRGSADAFAKSRISEQVFGLRIADWDPVTRTARIFPVVSSSQEK